MDCCDDERVDHTTTIHIGTWGTEWVLSIFRQAFTDLGVAQLTI